MRETTIKIPQTIEEWEQMTEAFKRDLALPGIEHGDYNKCPKCKRLIGSDESFCGKCGQRIIYVKSEPKHDVVPF